MTRRLRLLSPRLLPVSLAVACAMLVTSCGTRDRTPRPPVVQSAPPAAAPGLDPIYGEWEIDKATQLRAQPSPGAPIVASLAPGQPVKVQGRVHNSDWVAVQTGGSTAYVRLYLLRPRGTSPVTSRGSTTTIAKPVDNAGPSIKAAPRRKIEAAPIPN